MKGQLDTIASAIIIAAGRYIVDQRFNITLFCLYFHLLVCVYNKVVAHDAHNLSLKDSVTISVVSTSSININQGNQPDRKINVPTYC